MSPLLIYIHGFKSSPLSEKALDVRRHIASGGLAVDYRAPALPDFPRAAYDRLTGLLDAQSGRRIALIGSSMGGFMATVLAERYGLKAVLINPVVRPSQLIHQVFGENENPYTGNRFSLDQSHREELRWLEVDRIRAPQNLLLMVQTGDETLDYRRAVDYYRDCKQVVEAGGDHRFQGFENHLPAVFEFLELT